jgi:hypothetical protein
MDAALPVYYDVSADGRTVAEAVVGNLAAARELIAAAVAAGSELVWAHSSIDLSGLGFAGRPGYRRLTGPARPGPGPGPGRMTELPRSGHGPGPGCVTELRGDEDTAELCAAAYSGQWGHKTPAAWPVPELAGHLVLGLRRDGLLAGICRLDPAAGLIDAPGLIPGQRDVAGYRELLAAALARITSGQATVESWGDEPDRVGACAELGLATAEYTPGWELSLAK